MMVTKFGLEFQDEEDLERALLELQRAFNRIDEAENQARRAHGIIGVNHV